MNKNLLAHALVQTLRGHFEQLQNSSKNTRSNGNDSESKSEGKYDTRSTEENYLADGLARQAWSAAQSVAACENLSLLTFDASTPIAISALVLIEFPDEQQWFFLSPAGGGIELLCEGTSVTVLSPESPLGSQLVGLKAGARTKFPPAKILEVQ